MSRHLRSVPPADTSYDWLEARDAAEHVDCPEPDCGATAGQPCCNVHDGGPLAQPAHFRRINAANDALGTTSGTATLFKNDQDRREDQV